MPAQQNGRQDTPLIHYIYYTRAHFLHTRRTDKCSLLKSPWRQPVQEHSHHPITPPTALKQKMQCAAMPNAARCDDRHTALQWPTHRTALEKAERTLFLCKVRRPSRQQTLKARKVFLTKVCSTYFHQGTNTLADSGASWKKQRSTPSIQFYPAKKTTGVLYKQYDTLKTT